MIESIDSGSAHGCTSDFERERKVADRSLIVRIRPTGTSPRAASMASRTAPESAIGAGHTIDPGSSIGAVPLQSLSGAYCPNRAHAASQAGGTERRSVKLELTRFGGHLILA
jgi:hypothetical protein